MPANTVPPGPRRRALAAGLAAVAAATGVLFVATSASGSTCPPPTHTGGSRPVGPVSVPVCTVDLGPVRDLLRPQCDPGPCDPSALAPQS